jgi:pilus assembly protein TadC
MIQELKKNVEIEMRMMEEIAYYSRWLDEARPDQKRLINNAIRALRSGIKILNSTNLDLLEASVSINKLPDAPSRVQKPDISNMRFAKSGIDFDVALKSKDREKFLQELSISEKFINKFKKGSKVDEEEYVEFKASRGYLKLANKLFLETANKLINKGYFTRLSVGLRQANIDILFESYVAMMIFSFFVSLGFSIILTVTLLFIDTSPIFPYLQAYQGEFMARFIQVFWIPFVLPVVTFLGFYYYPSTEKKSIGKRIDQELPFAVIHMSAISGSGIEPTEIFKIIGLSKEYPNLRKEIRKVLNQINLYGYDLTTALNNAAQSAPSENLTELFNGLSTSISSGADLSDFFEKRSESLLLSYRVEREKYTRLVETFLDIYISIVIAAPMIFLLLLIMMAVSGIEVGLEPYQISILAVFIISLLNVMFLIFLGTKQPSY